MSATSNAPSGEPRAPRTRGRLFIVVAVLAIVLAVLIAGVLISWMGGSRATVLGVAYSPANHPASTPEDVAEFFRLARAIGSHVTLIVQWDAMPALSAIAEVQRLSRAHDLDFHLHLSPTALYGGCQDPAIPASVGGTSFNDSAVRTAFIAQAQDLAALTTDVLGLGTEINLLAQNRDEFAAYISLAREAYEAVRSRHPSQTVTVSFQ